MKRSRHKVVKQEVKVNVKSVIARAEKEFCSKRKPSTLPSARMTSNSQGREPSPQKNHRDFGRPKSEEKSQALGRDHSKDFHKEPSHWFGPQFSGRRKVARPYQSNAPMEVKLSMAQARRDWAFTKPTNQKQIRSLLRSVADASSVDIKKVVLEGPGVLILRVETAKREDLSRFLRIIAGRIPRVVTGVERGRPLRGKFWKGLASSRCL